MTTDLGSPTCAPCARAKGYEPRHEEFTQWSGRCENCDRETTVASARNWTLSHKDHTAPPDLE
jgi:hypothetical protein